MKIKISDPFDVQRGGASTSPIVQIDAKARVAVPNWSAATLHQKVQAVFKAFVQVFREKRWKYIASYRHQSAMSSLMRR